MPPNYLLLFRPVNNSHSSLFIDPFLLLISALSPAFIVSKDPLILVQMGIKVALFFNLVFQYYHNVFVKLNALYFVLKIGRFA